MAWSDNVFTRHFPGKTDYSGDPLVKGYGFTYIELPTDVGNASDSAKLAALTRGVSGIGQISLEAESIEGIGGVKFTVPTKLTLPDRISVEYIEIQDTFVFNLHKKWINLIRDLRYGATNLQGTNYTKDKYSGLMWVWITLPDAKTIVDAYLLTGVYPVSLPIDALGYNMTDVAKVDLTIEYAFDQIYWYKKSDGSGECSAIKSSFESKIGAIVDKVKNYHKNFCGK